jgi:hypothetical protein
MRFFGSSLLFLTLTYSLMVVIPAYGYGVHNLMATGIHDVPAEWNNTSLLLIFPSLVMVILMYFGGPSPLVVLLSVGLLGCILRRGKSRSWREITFWSITLVASGIFFYTSTYILEIWQRSLMD